MNLLILSILSIIVLSTLHIQVKYIVIYKYQDPEVRQGAGKESWKAFIVLDFF